MSVNIEQRSDDDGSWRVVETVDVEIISTTQHRFLWWRWESNQYESSSETLKRAVIRAREIRKESPKALRVVHYVGACYGEEMFCVFWQNGQWLRSAVSGY